MATQASMLQGAAPSDFGSTNNSRRFTGAAPANLPNANSLQVTANPMNVSGFSGTGSTDVLGANTTKLTPTTPTGPTAEQIAAAEKTAKINQARTSITGLVNSIRGVYDALYGDVGAVAQDKASQVEQKYGVENQALTNQFNEQFPAIGRAFSSRGTYNSSYRSDAENAAQKSFQDALAQQNIAKQGELGGIGQFVAESQASIQGGRGALDLVLQQINQSDNEQELQSVMNELQSRMASLQQQRAGTQPQNYYLGKLNEAVPSASRLPQLQASLANVVASSVPGTVKQSIVTQLINNAQLSPQEKEQIMAQYMGQINAEEQQKVA